MIYILAWSVVINVYLATDTRIGVGTVNYVLAGMCLGALGLWYIPTV